MPDGSTSILSILTNVRFALRERDHGFKAAVADYPEIKVTEIEVKVPGQVDDAYNRVTNLLLANPDINAIWGGWDELVAPSVRAINPSHGKHTAARYRQFGRDDAGQHALGPDVQAFDPR